MCSVSEIANEYEIQLENSPGKLSSFFSIREEKNNKLNVILMFWNIKIPRWDGVDNDITKLIIIWTDLITKRQRTTK